jgi:Flp pilus assembly protein TadG
MALIGFGAAAQRLSHRTTSQIGGPSPNVHHKYISCAPSFISDIRGNVAVIFAIAIIPIMGFLGGAADYSIVSKQRTTLQGLLDSALLAGIQETTSSAEISKANSFFFGNLKGTWQPLPTASFSVVNGQLVGSASAVITTQFLGIVGYPTIQVSVSAAAVATTSSTKACIILVSSTASQTLLVNSGASLTGTSCEIDVDSNNSTAAMINSSTSLNVAKVCIKGGATQNGGSNPAVSPNCSAISNPFVGTLPGVSSSACNYNNQTYNGGSVTLMPGRYCGWTNFNGSGTLTFSPGLYVVQNGGMTFNSSWTVSGTGVTFYLVDQNATLTFNSNVNASFSAPTSGTYANILMYEPDGLPQSNLPINGSSGSSLQGLLYLPSRAVTINSVSNVTATQTVMVLSTLTLNNMNWNISPGALAPNGGAPTTASGTARLVR